MNNELLSDINWLAVLVAALAYFILGAIWYSKALFAPKWAKLVGLEMNSEANKKGLGAMMMGSSSSSLLPALPLPCL